MAENIEGGPIMKLIRSFSIIRRPAPTSQRSISTAFMPAAPGTSTALSSPEMWASGAGMSTASPPDSPWTRVIVSAL